MLLGEGASHCTQCNLPLSVVVHGVYFTESSHSVVIPSSLSVGDEVTVMHVHSTPSVGHPAAIGTVIDCVLERVRTHPGSGSGGGREAKPRDWPFHVAPTESRSAIRILVAVPLDPELRSNNGKRVLEYHPTPI